MLDDGGKGQSPAWPLDLLVEEHRFTPEPAQPRKTAAATFVAFCTAGLLPLLPFVTEIAGARTARPALSRQRARDRNRVRTSRRRTRTDHRGNPYDKGEMEIVDRSTAIYRGGPRDVEFERTDEVEVPFACS